MRKVFMINRISVDGFYASNNQAMQGMDWFIHDPLVDAAIHKPINADTLVLGHSTFRLFESSWVPVLTDPNANPIMKGIAEELTRMRKLVFSRSTQVSDWDNTEFCSEDPQAVISRMRHSDGPDLLILGSGSIVRILASSQGIDEYIFIVSPTISGSGKPLFPGLGRCDLDLVSSQGFDSGNVVLHYKLRANKG